MFECVANVSEGRRLDVIDELAEAAGASLRDVHRDAVHNRSVFTLIDEVQPLTEGVRALARAALTLVDLREHEGVHPRFGVLDVVPFVALDPIEAPTARQLRDETADWLADTFYLPVFLYGELKDGTSRSLPDVRRRAFASLDPDRGPTAPDPLRGASAVGARGVLVAWNLWLRRVTLNDASRIAARIRRPEVRSLAFSMGDVVQVSIGGTYDRLTRMHRERYIVLDVGMGDVDRHNQHRHAALREGRLAGHDGFAPGLFGG